MKAPNTSRLLTHLISFRKQCSDFEKTLMNGRCAHLIYKSPSISWICQTRNLSIHNHKPEFLPRFTTKVQNVKGKRNLVRDNNGSSATWAINFTSDADGQTYWSQETIACTAEVTGDTSLKKKLLIVQA